MAALGPGNALPAKNQMLASGRCLRPSAPKFRERPWAIASALMEKERLNTIGFGSQACEYGALTKVALSKWGSVVDPVQEQSFAVVRHFDEC